MIDIPVTITGSRARTPNPNAGNAHEHNMRQLVFTTDWPEDAEGYIGDPLIKTIVFVTPAGVETAAYAVTDNKIPLESAMLDGQGYLQFTIYGKKPGEDARNASDILQVGAALSDLGGVTPAAYADITSNCIDATAASVAQTGLCADATGAAEAAATSASFKSVNEFKKYLSNLKLGSDADYAVDGVAIISSPESLIFMQALGDNSGPVIFDIIGTKGGYGSAAGGNNEGLLSEYSDLGYYPYIINRPNATDSRYGTARWKQVGKGYPSGILEYIFSADPKTAHSLAFVRDEVLYLVFDLSNINDLKYGLTLKSSEGTKNFTGGYEKPGEQGYIAVKDNTSGLWLVATCTTMNEYQVDTAPITVIYGLDESHNVVEDSACSIALGKDGVGTIGQVVFCFSSSIIKSDAIAAALTGLTNFDTKRLEAEADWVSFFDGLEVLTVSLPVEHKIKLYSCLREIRCLSYNGYLSAGLPNWYKNFIRDTSWAIIGLCSLGHTQSTALAEGFADFFSTIDSFVHANSYTLDGKRCETTMNQTDSAATFLLAIGKLFAESAYDATAIKTALDEALSYAQDNFVSADGHITCLHAHDFWDDYVPEITVSDVKYESMVDVLWIAGLEAIAPVYEAMGDSVRALFCITTAAALKASIEDFRNADGGLHYAIKTNDTLYDTVETLPGTLYAAWLLEDANCAAWVLSHGSHLLPRNGGVRLPMTHSNNLTDALKEEVWMPYVPIVAMLAGRAGDSTLASDLSSAFAFSGFPEYGKYQKADELIWKSHAFSFPWAEAMYLVMIADML